MTIEMKAPAQPSKNGCFYEHRAADGIVVRFNRLQTGSQGSVIGDISIWKPSPSNNGYIAQDRTTLTNSKKRYELEKSCSAVLDRPDWYDIIEAACFEAVKKFEEGEPAEEVWPDMESNLTPSYYLEPIIILNQPNVWFGGYESCKSITALATAYIGQLPFKCNPLGWTTLNEPSPCLYLDYEDDKSNFMKRWTALERGFNQGEHPILYKRMTSPLYDVVEPLRKLIKDRKIKFMIVDSLGLAARGNLNDPEPAIRYHAALRELNITSLTLAHTSKDQFTGKKTIFGSVFFTNLARSVWECRAEREPERSVVVLNHTKANLSRRHEPLGMYISFSDKVITFDKFDVIETESSRELPLPWQIKDLLRSGALTSQEIADNLGKSIDTVRTTLTRMKDKELVSLPEHKWGLKTRE